MYSTKIQRFVTIFKKAVHMVPPAASWIHSTTYIVFSRNCFIFICLSRPILLKRPFAFEILGVKHLTCRTRALIFNEKTSTIHFDSRCQQSLRTDKGSHRSLNLAIRIGHVCVGW